VRTTALLLLASGLALAPDSRAGAGADALQVRSSLAAAPCVRAAASGWPARIGRPVVVEVGALRDEGAWDVLVGSSVELTRALEGRDAVSDSDVEIAEIPWVLCVAPGSSVRSLEDLARSGAEATVLGGDAAYDVRRALAEKGVGRVRETSDAARLRSAPVALVPLSLAGGGEHRRVDVRPITIGAAVGVRARHPEDGFAFVRHLGSEAGQQAFAACAPAQ
jgi:hypothetical protein